MLNENYRRKRGTNHKFRATEAEAAAEWERLYPEAVARARERKLRPKKQGRRRQFSVEDED